MCPALVSDVGTQGDNIFAVIFDIVYTYLVLKPLRERHAEATVFAIHDDTYLLTARADALAPVSASLVELARPHRLSYNATKRKLFQLLPPPDAADADDLAWHLSSFPRGAALERRAIKAGGIWLGDPEAVAQRCEQSARKYGRHVGAVAAAPMRVQSAMILLSYCCRPLAKLTILGSASSS